MHGIYFIIIIMIIIIIYYIKKTTFATFSRTSKKKVTLALKCMANYKSQSLIRL